MLDLHDIYEICQGAIYKKNKQDDYMSDEVKKSCELFIQAYIEGRIQIVPKKP